MAQETDRRQEGLGVRTPMMKFVKPLSEITDADLPLFGGKAFQCARLRKAGLPVPDGIAVSTQGMGRDEAISEVQKLLLHFPQDALFAVRSSATDEDAAGYSFAGVHETKLNVSRDGIAEAIRTCWASVTSPRALAYRHAQQLPTEGIRTGVLVQEMVKSVVSGVGFTVNPVTGKQELVINASLGLGEAMVSGLVEPDEFIVRKSDGNEISTHIGRKRFRPAAGGDDSGGVATEEQEARRPSLREEQVKELGKLLLRIEEFYGSPQDVEWCHDGKQFWIVQSRPVTAAPSRGPDIEWTRANFCEVLPDLPAPQVREFLSQLLNRAEQAFYGPLLARESELGPIIKLFFGRFYLNLSQLRHICRVTGEAPAVILRAVGHAEDIRPEDEMATPPDLRTRIRVLPKLLELLWLQVGVGSKVREYSRWFEKRIHEMSAADPQKLSDLKMWEKMESWFDVGNQQVGTILVLTGVTMYESQLRRLVERVGFPFQRLLLSHLAAGSKSVSAQQAFDLRSLAIQARKEDRVRDFFSQGSDGFQEFRAHLAGTQFLQQFDSFLERYGHRGPHESDWSLPRYRENPIALLVAIAAHVQAPAREAPKEILERQEREAVETWQAFQAKLSPWQRLTVLPRVRWLLRRIKRMYLWREQYRSDMIRPLAEGRKWHLELARRLVGHGWIEQPEDYFYLTIMEIRQVVCNPGFASDLRAIVEKRKAEQAAWQSIEMPLLLRESELAGLMRRKRTPDVSGKETRLQGLCVSAGCVEGEVVVLHDSGAVQRMKPGAILVAPATDPAWSPLFTLASGVIVEVGGTLSHASTVTREYGLPALANVRNATKLLKTGDRVRLDATNGFVEVLTDQHA